MIMQETVKESTSKPNRIEKWDIVRAILIFLVVLGHMTDYYTEDEPSLMRGLFLFIYTFHIPCFIFLDGLFSKRTVNERRYNRIFSYFILYLFIQILNKLVNGLINHSISFSLWDSDGPHWYGLFLFNACLITIFLRRFSKKWVMAAAIVLACFVGYDSDIGDYMVLSRTIVFYPFFFAGYCMDPVKLVQKLSAVWVKIGGLAVMVLLAFVCFNYTDDIYFVRVFLTGRNPYHSLESVYGMDNLVFYGGLMRLVYYLIVFIVCFALIGIVPNHLPHGGWATNIGKHSLQIYVLHRSFIYILYNLFLFKVFSEAHGISSIIIIPIAFLLTLFLSLPFWEKPIRAVVYPKALEDKKKVDNDNSGEV